MLNLGSDIKIYLSCGVTDMRKGINGLSILASCVVSKITTGAMFVFRGKRSDRIKILWWDGQGFCLYYKVMDKGKFAWLKSNEVGVVGVTRAQLSMLLEGIDWRSPIWSNKPKYS